MTYFEDTSKKGKQPCFFLGEAADTRVLQDPEAKGKFLSVVPAKSRIIEDPSNKGISLKVVEGVDTFEDPENKGTFVQAVKEDYLCDDLVEKQEKPKTKRAKNSKDVARGIPKKTARGSAKGVAKKTSK